MRSARNDRAFNEIQREMLGYYYYANGNVYSCAAHRPARGRLLLMELALLLLLVYYYYKYYYTTTTTTTVGVSTTSTTMERRREGRTKVVYLAPLKALVAEKLNDWERRFGNGTRFNLRFVLLTGDVDEEKANRVLERGGSSGRDTGNAGKNGFIVETSFLKWVLWIFRIYFCGFDR